MSVLIIKKIKKSSILSLVQQINLGVLEHAEKLVLGTLRTAVVCFAQRMPLEDEVHVTPYAPVLAAPFPPFAWLAAVVCFAQRMPLEDEVHVTPYAPVLAAPFPPFAWKLFVR
ncbi:hypothetical protein AK812_SmicGene40453 [Symbiodinium microadriaticum]|uniref:Uncharacterized protein n=1 Tax=Symbiodinium microadriaticum TaxID=2951 RepID=A0A1Q9C8Q0_SYMMI|nr:hypothetical protein AK812_SmicGene40453 [Symbiodinium microadriaticum]